jgi:hypothetical protein
MKLICSSPSDKNQNGLYFNSLEKAEYHQERMNFLLQFYPEGFNVEYWKDEPLPWEIKEVV